MTDEQPLSRRAAREGAAKPARSPRGRAASADPAATAVASEANAGGLMGFIRSRPKTMLAIGLSLGFVLLGGGAVYAGALVGSQPQQAAAPIEPGVARTVPLDTALPTLVRTCSVHDETLNPALVSFAGSVINAATGEVLLDRSAHVPAPTANVTMALIAVTAMTTLGPDYRMTTQVYEGSEPGSVVLVGGGDPTLSVLPSSFYPGAPSMKNLADQVKAKWNELHPPQPAPGSERPPRGDDDGGDEGSGEEDEEEERPDPEPEPEPELVEQPITKLVLDLSMWSLGDRWDPAWPQEERTIGTMPNLVPLMIDGDRQDGRQAVSPRSNDPAGAAATAFVHSLGLSPSNVQVTTGSAITTRPLLGEVSSQPLRNLVEQMLNDNDYTLAEMIARVVSAETGSGGSAASLSQVVGGALGQLLGVDATGLLIKDGSGLNPGTVVPPKLVAEVFAKVHQDAGDTRTVAAALPVAGQTGPLAARFTGDNAIARGAVFAMPGAHSSARTLAGLITAEDGTPLAFSFHALGPVAGDAHDALETLATAVWRCGDNLSNN